MLIYYYTPILHKTINRSLIDIACWLFKNFIKQDTQGSSIKNSFLVYSTRLTARKVQTWFMEKIIPPPPFQKKDIQFSLTSTWWYKTRGWYKKKSINISSKFGCNSWCNLKFWPENLVAFPVAIKQNLTASIQYIFVSTKEISLIRVYIYTYSHKIWSSQEEKLILLH